MERISVIFAILLKSQEKIMFCKRFNRKRQIEKTSHRARFVIVCSIGLVLFLSMAGGITGCAEKQLSRGIGAKPVDGAIMLFDGTSFDNWTNGNSGPAQWEIVDGAMEIVPDTISIITKEKFRDIRLHVEFSVPLLPDEAQGPYRGNSGVYIQRRYEIQILDSYGKESKSRDCGAIYGFKPPDKNVCRKPEQWQSYDILFRAARFTGEGVEAKKVENARITVYHNSVLIHDDVEVPNKTGRGKPEGPEDAPILFQSQGQRIKFRNIWVERLD
jgi:hypothetical protein